MIRRTVKPRTRTSLPADRLFRALADPTRLRILRLLRAAGRGRFDDRRGCCPQAGLVCVCDLTRVLDAPQPTVSRHLAYLRRSGLVRQRRQGLWKYYRLSPARSTFHRKLLECLDACVGEPATCFSDDARRLRASCSQQTTANRCCEEP